MWSGPTPPEGVIAEVIELQRASDLRIDIKGKLVLTAENPAGIKWLLACCRCVLKEVLPQVWCST
jgi:hypothetical protein